MTEVNHCHSITITTTSWSHLQQHNPHHRRNHLRRHHHRLPHPHTSSNTTMHITTTTNITSQSPPPQSPSPSPIAPPHCHTFSQTPLSTSPPPPHCQTSCITPTISITTATLSLLHYNQHNNHNNHNRDLHRNHHHLPPHRHTCFTTAAININTTTIESISHMPHCHISHTSPSPPHKADNTSHLMRNSRITNNHIIASAVTPSSSSPTSESAFSTQQIIGSAFKKMAGKYGAARFKPASSHLTPSISRSHQTQLTSPSSCGLSAERPAAARRRPISSRCCRQSL